MWENPIKNVSVRKKKLSLKYIAFFYFERFKKTFFKTCLPNIIDGTVQTFLPIALYIVSLFLYTSRISLTPSPQTCWEHCLPKRQRKENAEKYKKTRNANFFTSS
jgi:hypothetical protein